jgi:hypothetical protein
VNRTELDIQMKYIYKYDEVKQKIQSRKKVLDEEEGADLSNITEEIFGKEIYDLTKSVTGKESAELNALVLQSIKLQEIYDGVFPKVDPRLVRDLFERMTQNPSIKPLYTVEVFTKNTIDSQWCKDHIFATTGFIPAIYDDGTHYVTNMRLTLDILKRLNDFDFVVEVTGDYTGAITAVGASHEVGAHRGIDLMNEREKEEALQQQKLQKQKGHSETKQINRKKMQYRLA